MYAKIAKQQHPKLLESNILISIALPSLRRLELVSCLCSPACCCARGALLLPRPTASSMPRGSLSARERHHETSSASSVGRPSSTILMEKLREANFCCLWSFADAALLRAASRELAERCPGVVSVGGPSGEA